MTMSPALRKLTLTAHVSLSVGWIGTVVAYLALGVAAVTRDDRTARAAWTAMDLIGWHVIVPLALGSLATGVVMAIGTRWGLFRHYWVLFSLVLTVFATVVLLLHMPSVSATAERAQQLEGASLDALGGDLLHPGIGHVVLLVVQVLNVYKPRGRTAHGRRQLNGRQEERAGHEALVPSSATRC